MPAPVQIGPAPTAHAHVGTYYIPPTGGGSTFAAAMSGFLKTRQPLATAVFMQRLKQSLPKDKNAEIAAAHKALADYRINGMTAENNHFKTMQQLYGNTATLKGQEMSANARVQTANTAASRLANNDILDYTAAMADKQELSPPDADAMSKIMNSLRSKAAMAANPTVDPVERAKAKEDFAAMLEGAFGESAMVEHTNPTTGEIEQMVGNGPMTSLAPIQRQKVIGDIHRMISTLGGDESIVPELAQAVDQYVGGQTQQQSPETDGYPAGGFMPGGGVGGGRTLRQGEALVDQMNEMGKAGLGGPRPGDANDPITQQYLADIARLEAENGTSEYVDFNAPVIKDKPFSDAWQSVLRGESGFAPGVGDYGTDPNHAIDQNAPGGNPMGFGFTPGAPKFFAGAPSDPAAGMTRDTPAPQVSSGQGGGGGRIRSAAARAPMGTEGADGTLGQPAGPTDQYVSHNNRMQLGSRTTLPGQTDELSAAAHDNLDPMQYDPRGPGGPGVAQQQPTRIPSAAARQYTSGMRGGRPPGGPAPEVVDWGAKLDWLSGVELPDSPDAYARRVRGEQVDPTTIGDIPDIVGRAIDALPGGSSAKFPEPEPFQRGTTPYVPPPAAPSPPHDFNTTTRGTWAPEQNQQEYLTIWNDGGETKPKVPVVPYHSKRGTTPYVAPPGGAPQDTAAPAAAEGGQSLYGAIQGAGQTQQGQPSAGGFSPEAEALMQEVLNPKPKMRK